MKCDFTCRGDCVEGGIFTPSRTGIDKHECLVKRAVGHAFHGCCHREIEFGYHGQISRCCVEGYESRIRSITIYFSVIGIVSYSYADILDSHIMNHRCEFPRACVYFLQHVSGCIRIESVRICLSCVFIVYA